MGFLDDVAGVFAAPLGAATGAIDKYVTHGSAAASQSADAQRRALDEAMKRLQQFSQEQYQNRMNDLHQTMQFYGPSQRYLESIYAQPGGAPTAAPTTQPPYAGPPVATRARRTSGF